MSNHDDVNDTQPDQDAGQGRSDRRRQPLGDLANVSIDPTHRPVLFTDSVLINSTPFGVTLDFAQTIGGTPNQYVVARVGMSAEHAKKLIQELNDHIDKNER